MAEIKYSTEFLAQQREVRSIRKDIDIARGIIEDALLRYKKKMLHAKSKKQTEDLSMFAELDGYSSKDDIQIVFGYGDISDDTMHRLWDLWDARENVVANQGRYTDRVTQILERAMENSGDLFANDFEDFDELVRRDNENRARIERENRDNSYKRYIAGL